MNTLKNSFIILIGFITILSCNNNAKPEIKTVEVSEVKSTKKVLNPNASYAKVEFGIEGMTCAMGCAKAIEKKMAKMDGVKSAKVDFDKRLAMVEFDEEMVTPKSLEEAVASVGDVYKVIDMKMMEEDHSSEKKSCHKEKSCKKACASKHQKDGKESCSKACKKTCKEKK